jgi:acyl-CoA synthetase (NDP forming)
MLWRLNAPDDEHINAVEPGWRARMESTMSYGLKEILNPRSIAIAGASREGRGAGFVSPLLGMEFEGPIYPVNPKYKEVSGLTCYPSVKAIPDDVDYVISSVPSTAALDLMKDCIEKGVKCVHYFTARFSETGRPEDAALEREILKTAKEGGVRIIGPNCMGLYNPSARIAMNEGMPRESGGVGLASQSGGVLHQIVLSTTARGVRFSQAISYGNAIDLNECDYLEYFIEDPATRVILLYIEGIKDGRRFIPALKKATAVKPVVILKGGRSDAGTRATASHTASLAGAYNVFQGLVAGAGAVLVKDFDEFVDLAVAFNCLPGTTGRNLGVEGGSGGSSVNAADLLAEAGLNVVAIPQEIRDKLKAEGIAGHDWFNNPIDGSISMGDQYGPGRVMELMAEHHDFQTFISFPPGPRWRRPGVVLTDEEKDIDTLIENALYRKTDKPVVVLAEDSKGPHRDREIEEIAAQVRQRLIGEGIAIFPTMIRVANALSKLIDFYDYQKTMTEPL